MEFEYYKLIDEKKRHYLQSIIIYFSVLIILLAPLFTAIANYYYNSKESYTGIYFEIFSALSAITIVIIIAFLIYGAIVFRIIIYLSAESFNISGNLKKNNIIKHLEWIENNGSNFWIIALLNSVHYFFLYFIVIYFPIIKSSYENNFLLKIFAFTKTSPWAGLKLFGARFLFGFIFFILIFFLYRFIAECIYNKIKNR